MLPDWKETMELPRGIIRSGHDTSTVPLTATNSH